MSTRRCLSVAIAAGLLLVGSAPVLAGGMEMPDNGTRALARGGAFTALADDLTAIAHNPGALIKLRGTSVLLNNHVFFIDERFTRAESRLTEDLYGNAELYGYSPLEEVRNEADIFPLGPMVIVGSDLGQDNLVVAFGVYGPNATGAAKWPLNGGQRYMLTELETILFYLTSSIAVGEKDHYGIGLSMQVAMAPVMRMRMVIDGSKDPSQLNPYASVTDVEALIDMADMFALSAIIGAWWRPIEEVEVGLSGRVIPVRLDAKGDFTLRNIAVPSDAFLAKNDAILQAQFTDEQLKVTNSSARLRMTLPPTLRAGIRYRHLSEGEELWDVEFDVVYEAWSLMRSMDVDLDGVINLFSGGNDTPNTTIARHWRDTVSFRLGGSLQFTDWGSVSGGAYYETGAVPPNYEHIDFMAFDRVGLSAGFAAQLGMFRVTAAYMHVFQMTRTVSEAMGKVFQQRPISPCPDDCVDGATGISGVPVNAGVFESGYDIVSFGLESSF